MAFSVKIFCCYCSGGKGKGAIVHIIIAVGVHLRLPCLRVAWWYKSKSLMHGSVWHQISGNLLASEYYCPSASSKFCCLVTEACTYKWLYSVVGNAVDDNYKVQCSTSPCLKRWNLKCFGSGACFWTEFCWRKHGVWWCWTRWWVYRVLDMFRILTLYKDGNTMASLTV